jgi:hypothetical protein
MRLALEAPERLAIHDHATGIRILGGILVVLGAVYSNVPGVACAVAGLLTILLPEERRIVIDREAGIVTIDRRGGGGWSRALYPLSAVADVVLEESDEEASTGRFRVAFVLRDEGRVPWTWSYSRAAAGARAHIDAVRRFLGTAALPPAVQQPRPRRSAT